MATSPGATQFALPQAAELLHRLAIQIRTTLKSPGADQVHDLRVAVRRCSQALAVMEDLVKRKHIEEVRRNLKQTMHLAGAVRDRDIAIKLVRRVGTSQRLQNLLHCQRATAQKELVDVLQNWIDHEVVSRWGEQLAASLNGREMRVDTEQIVSRALRRLFARGKAAEESPEALHPLRIAAKKLRYTLDLLAPPSPERMEQIKTLQSRLGDINDYAATRRIVKEAGAAKTLQDQLQDKQEKKIHQFRHYWDAEFGGKANAKKWTHALLEAVA